MGRRLNTARSLALSLCAMAISSCAATTYSHRTGDHRVSGAFEQPFRDTSWMRENPPEVLIRAAEAPYALESGSDCGVLLGEIVELDAVLGPDVDVSDGHRDESSTDALGLISGAIGGVVGLPYRSLVRRLSGADRRARVLRGAIFAGMVRRAFLKGAAQAADCATPAEPSPQQVAGEAPQQNDSQE
jgi:hypothetical protein